jgi:hypothetical protein
MKKIFERIKPILVLAGMSLVSFVSVWIVNQIRTVFNGDMVQDTQAYVLTEPGDSSIEQETIDLSQPVKIEELEKQLEKEIEESGMTEGEVLSEETYKCESDIMKIESESVCVLDSTNSVDYRNKEKNENGTIVNKESAVILTKVTVPLDLYSGMVVANSNRKITSDTPTFKAAGEQVDEVLADQYLPPGQKIKTHRPWDEDVPFATNYTMGFGTKEYNSSMISTEGEVGIQDKLENDCDSQEYNNSSNVNPDKSNNISSFIKDSVYTYPNQQEIEKKEIIEVCNEDVDRFEKWETDMVACSSSTIKAKIITIKDALWWKKCEEDENNCIIAENIVIIMESPFGSEEECDDEGVCTNAFMRVRNDSAAPPANTDGTKFYYLTDCEAVVETHKVIVQCAWDMSHIYKERKINEYDDLPNLEDTPTEDEYNEFLLYDVRGKRDTPVPL